MLTLTSNAAEAVKTIAEETPQLPEESGLRIHARPNSEGSLGLELTMVEEPEDGDQVIEEAGARVFVEPVIAGYLEDKILDADVTENRVQFSVTEQE